MSALSDSRDEARERRKRNIALALALGGFVVLFYLMTMVRIGGHVVNWFD